MQGLLMVVCEVWETLEFEEVGGGGRLWTMGQCSRVPSPTLGVAKEGNGTQDPVAGPLMRSRVPP